MENFYSKLKILAKTTKSQNRFTAAKEISSIHLFRNNFDFSKIQEIYLFYLYNYDNINRAIIIDKISKHVLDSDIYEEAYLLWKRKNTKITNKTDNKQKEVNLVTGKHIKFPKRV